MVALTYGDTRVSGVETKTATKTKAATATAPRKTWFARFFDAMVEARMRQAERELRLYRSLNAYPLDEIVGGPVKSATTETPRGGW